MPIRTMKVKNFSDFPFGEVVIERESLIQRAEAHQSMHILGEPPYGSPSFARLLNSKQPTTAESVELTNRLAMLCLHRSRGL